MTGCRFFQDVTENMRRRTAARVSTRLMILAGLAVSMGYVMYVAGIPNPVSAQSEPIAPVDVTLDVVMSANQEAPGVIMVPSDAGGTGTLTINAARTEIAYDLTFTGPFTGEPQQAHIHLAPIGANGPVVFFLCSADPTAPAPAPIQACPGMMGGTLQGTLTAADFIPRPEAGAAMLPEALEAIISGNAYINLHTPANPGGETRGQLGQVDLGAILSSAAEVPPVMVPSEAMGTATVTLPPERGAITYEVTLNGPFTGDVTAAHIHMGAAGEAGPVMFNLCPPDEAICVPMAGGTLVGTLVETDLMQPEMGMVSFAEAIDALISGKTYINTHTMDNPPGEVRGQIQVALTSMLSSAEEVPPVVVPSEATGSALVVLNRDRSAVTYSLALTGPFTGDPTQAHIHVAPRGEAGPPAAFICAAATLDPPAPEGTQLCPDAMGGTLTGTITMDNFLANEAMGFGTFEEFVAFLATGGTYFNVHTTDNPPPARLAAKSNRCSICLKWTCPQRSVLQMTFSPFLTRTAHVTSLGLPQV